MELTVRKIASLLSGEIEGSPDLKVNKVANIQDAQPNQITFLSNPKYESYIYTTLATAVIVKQDFLPKKKIQPTLIRVQDSYLSFTRLLEEWHRYTALGKSGIEEPSYRGKEVAMGKNVYQGAFSYIGDNAKIGNNVRVYPHTFVGDNVIIGDNTTLYAGVKLYASTQIGNNCTLHSGVVIGSDGFGFAPEKNGSYKSIPQLGNVILGDNVSVGANTTIDCATLFGQSTVVQSGVKLDNLIQVGHNVEIGENTVIAAQAGISGSSKLGKQCVVAGQVGVIGHLTIADKTILGAQAGIIRSVDEKGNVLLGSPAMDRKEYLRSYVLFKKLPQLEGKIEQLEKQFIVKKNMNNSI